MARGDAGTLFIPTRLDLDQARKDLTQTLPREAKRGGEQTAAELLKGLRGELNQKIGRAREALTRGLIDKKEFRRLSNDAKKEFNAGILPVLRQMQKEGKQNTAEYTRLSKSLKTVTSDARRAGRTGTRSFMSWQKVAVSLRNVFAGMAAFLGARALGRFFAGSVRQAEEASSVWALLEQQVENTGTSFAAVRQEIEATARTFQNTTRFGDEDFAGALTEVVGITNDYRLSLEHMDLVLDIAAGKKMDLASAARLVGRTIVGETSLLKRYGIVVEEGADAIEVMRARFSGLAENEGAKLSGRLQRLRNEWGDIRQAIGDAIVGGDEAGDTLTGLASHLVRLERWIRENQREIRQFTSDVVTATAGLAELAALLAKPFVLTFRVISDPREAWRRFREGQVGFEEGMRAESEAERRARFESTFQGGRPVNLLGEPVATASQEEQEAAEQAKQEAEDAEDRAKQAEKAWDNLLKKTAVFREAAAAGIADLERAPESVAKKLEELVRLGEELAEAEKATALLGGKVPEGTEEYLESVRARIAGLRADLAEMLDIPAVTVELVNSLGPPLAGYVLRTEQGLESAASAFAGLAVQVRDVAAAEEELAVARLTLDSERIEAAERRLAKAREEVAEAGAAIVASIEAANLSVAEQKRLIDQVRDAFQKAGIDVDKVGDELEETEDKTRRLVSHTVLLVRGVLSAADAMGVLDDDTRQALTGLLDLLEGVQQLRDSVEEINAAGGLTLGDVPGLLAGVTALAGGVAGLLGAISGGGGRDDEAIRENNQRLRELTAGIAELSHGLAGISGESFTGVASALKATLDAGVATIPSIRDQQLRNQLARLGLTMDDLEEVARSLGIEFDGSKESMEQLQAAIHEFEFSQLFETFGGQLSLLQQKFEIMDIDDPIEQLRQFLNVIHQFAGAEIDPPVWNLDSEEGRGLAKQWVQKMFQLLQSGEITPEQLGGMSLDEFRDFLSEFNQRLEDAGEAAQAGGGGLVAGPEVTRLSRRVLERSHQPC